ncbi:hypothetical protein [Methylobacterium sp. D48H]
MAHGKEVHYFDENWQVGLDFYNKGFYQHFSGEKYIGDITPNYWQRSCIERIASQIGTNVKITACVRFPVARSFSHYCHNIRDIVEHRPFLEALRNSSVYTQPSGTGHIYKRLRELFPPENILLLIFERDFTVSNYEKTCSRILDFLNLDSNPLPSKPENSGFLPVIELIKFNQPTAATTPETIHRAGDFVIHTLLEAKYPTTKIIRNPDRLNFERMYCSEFRTSHTVTPDEVFSIYNEFFSEDVEILRDLTNDPIDEWRTLQGVGLVAPPRVSYPTARMAYLRELSNGPHERRRVWRQHLDEIE